MPVQQHVNQNTSVYKKKISNKTVMSHGQKVPVAHGKDQRSFIITVFIHLFQRPLWSRVNLHTSLEIYGPSLICIISCSNLKTLAHYYNLSDRKVLALSCLVQYSQIHSTGCDTLVTFIHISPCRNAFEEGNIRMTFFLLLLCYGCYLPM